MNRHNLEVAVWLDKIAKQLIELREDAFHRKQCSKALQCKTREAVYGKVSDILIEAVNKINEEFKNI